MNSDVNKKLNDLLSGVDKNKLDAAKKSVEKFINSNDGDKLKQQLKNVDKNKLLNKFMNMDSNEMKSVLQKANLSNLSPDDVSSILNKLNKGGK